MLSINNQKCCQTGKSPCPLGAQLSEGNSHIKQNKNLNVMYYIIPENAGDDYKVQYFSPSGKDYYYKIINDKLTIK